MQQPTHIRLVVHGARRQTGHHDWPHVNNAPTPSLDAVVAAARPHPTAGTTWLSGGEPTLRADLPALIERLTEHGHAVGLDTDGLALSRPAVLAGLKARGLTRLRIPLHSIIAAAHDWVEGAAGSGRRTRKTAAAAQAVGIPLEINTLVTRSTVSHLVDTVRAAHALGARRVVLRRPRQRGAAGSRFVTVSPRLGLAEPYLEAAAARGRDLGVKVRIDGFPRCTVRRVRTDVLTADRELWVVPNALAAVLPIDRLDDEPDSPCARCPGLPVCAGAPTDYVARFGRLELDDPGLSRDEQPTPSPHPRGTPPPPPPPRNGRSPATRLRFAVRQSSLDNLGGDPTAGMGRNPKKPLEMGLSGTTRSVKVEMVRLAQSGPAPLQVRAGADLLRPEAHALLRELLRLGFTEITVRGDVTALGRRSRRSLSRLKGITRFEAELQAPALAAGSEPAANGTQAEASAAALHALAAATGATVGIRALLPNAPPPHIHSWLHSLHRDLPSTPIRFDFDSKATPLVWARLIDESQPKIAQALRSALERAANSE